MSKKVNHKWSYDKTAFVKNKSDNNKCSVCGLQRRLVIERIPFLRKYYLYYNFRLRETRHRPDCLQGNKDQIKMF